MTMMSLAEADAALTAAGQRFEIEHVDIRGVPTLTYRNAPATLPDILRASRDHGDAVFIVYEGERLTFAEHFRAACALGHTLRDRFGIREGDRVAIAMRNFPEWCVAFWAAASAGAVVVPLNAWWSAEELWYGLHDSGSRVLFADTERAGRIAGRRPDLPDLEAVVVARPGSDRLPPDVLSWDRVVGVGPADVEPPRVSVASEDDATIFYTSGTTGRPKGAVGTHRNICTSPMNVLYSGARDALRSGAVPGAAGPSAYLLSVPLFHVTGCHSLMVGHLLSGGKLVMMHRWDPGRALQLIEEERITSFGGVPSMAIDVLNHQDFEKFDTSSVKGVRYGGAPAPPDLVKRIRRAFNTAATNGYGMTETSALATINTGEEYLRKPDSVGRPLPVVEVRIVDGDGAAVPAGELGELWVKGPNVVRGYWNRPEATAQTFSDGWVHTGDVARMDDEGFVYIVDRAKDMLIRGGENIYSVEIEGVLFEHPAVAEAAVIGVPHPTLGEEVGAVITTKAGATVTASELQRFVGERLAAFKVPVRIWFLEGGLPRNPAGKVLKRDLRERLLAG